ncbi:endonuclease V [Streptomyces sp. NPDC005648]|uniref:endonuclease V n=1 Tax=Streptomyces sp. NPDC005648 TaxID=3157044 RepID=UPI0033A88CC5
MTTVSIPAGWPATEEDARAVQDGLRARVVLDEPGPPPGTGHVTGVDVAYDDERDVVGHRTTLDNACAHVLALTPAYRLPETTRRADALCRRALREATGTGERPGVAE